MVTWFAGMQAYIFYSTSWFKVADQALVTIPTFLLTGKRKGERCILFMDVSWNL